MLEEQQAATLSVIFYLTVEENDSVLNGVSENIVNSNTYINVAFQFIAATYVNGQWKYNRKKAVKILKKLNFHLKKPTFEELVEKVVPIIDKKVEYIMKREELDDGTKEFRLPLPSVGLGVTPQYIHKKVFSRDVQLSEKDKAHAKTKSILYTAGWCLEGAFTTK